MLLIAQGAIALLVLGTIALLPPARGTMMLLPLRPDAADHLAARALAAGARLIGSGPIAGSLIVDGTRARLGQIGAGGLLILNAPAGWCGRPPAAERLA